MSFFGIGGSSAKSNTTNNAYNFNNAGSGPSQNIAGITTGKNSTLTLSDYGAVSGGLSLASQALASNKSAFENFTQATSDLASKVVAGSLSVANKNQVSDSAQWQDTLTKVAFIGGSVAALIYIFGKR